MMARHKNMVWCLPDGTPNADGWRTHPWESITAALLMDVRDELQAMRARLDCVETLGMPRSLQRIAKAVEVLATANRAQAARRRKRTAKPVRLRVVRRKAG
jgi:hypothetical protein